MKIKHLFICSTPFQLITVLNLKINYFDNESANLMILDHNKHSLELYNKLKDLKIFNKVYYIRSSQYNTFVYNMTSNRIKKYFFKPIEYLFHKKIFSFFINDKYIYDYFWCSSLDYSIWIQYMFYKNKNYNLKFNLFEDGIGSYSLINFKTPKYEKFLLKFFGFSGIYEEIKKIYLYKPEIIFNNINKKEIFKISFLKNEKLFNVLKEIFDFEIEKFSKYMFLEQPLHFVEGKLNKQLEIMENLNKEINLTVKLHPRTKYSYKDLNNLNLCHSNITMEIISLKYDISNTTLITPYSTGAFTPYIFFNQTPRVILLYKLLNMEKYLPDDFAQVIKKLKKIYPKNKFFIPETYSELLKILKE